MITVTAVSDLARKWVTTEFLFAFDAMKPDYEPRGEPPSPAASEASAEQFIGEANAMLHSDASTLLAGVIEHCRSRRCEAAIGLSQAAAELDPANAYLHYSLGICYSGACRSHSLVDLRVAHAHLATALSLLGTAADPLQRAQVLAALGNTYPACRYMTLKGRMMAAIDCHQQASLLFQSAGQLDDWAREEFNLGNAFSDLPAELAPDKWREAIRHYECGLQVRTREKDPDAYAGTLQNLGIAYRELAIGDRRQNIRRSIHCYRRALQVRRRSSHPRGYTALHVNVGNSFMSLASLEETNAACHVLRALRHYDRALAVCASEHSSRECAMARFNRGEALMRIARDSVNPSVYLNEARSSLQQAAEDFQRLNDIELASKSRHWLDTVAQYLETQ